MRNVFFSFHYDDVWRANQVRNSWVTKGGVYKAGFRDKAEFEQIKRQGDAAIKRWIDNQMSGTSVTVVLLGKETLERPYVQYEIERSIALGKPIIGVKINLLKDSNGITGLQPDIFYPISGKSFYSIAHGIYCYCNENGYNNLSTWIENAARSK